MAQETKDDVLKSAVEFVMYLIQVFNSRCENEEDKITKQDLINKINPENDKPSTRE